jgi:dolichyl-phosphate beta-glucosyltransferase
VPDPAHPFGAVPPEPPGDPTLAIVVPAYNEVRRLPNLFAHLDEEGAEQARSAGLELVQVIVVDDGSSDGTGALLDERALANRRLHVIHFPHNRGKGAAVRAGVLSAAARFALVTDVDLSTPLSDLSALMDAIRAGNDLAIGSRGLPSSHVLIHQPRHRELMGRCFNLGLRLLTGLPYHDTQCGFKLFDLERTRQLFELQRIEGFAFDAELCMNAARLHLDIAEVPVEWSDDRNTTVTLLGSPIDMALDLARLSWSAHRPRRHPPETGSARDR